MFFFCNTHHECDCILFNDSFHSNSPQAVHNWRRHSTKRTRQVRETWTVFCCRVWDEEMTVACFYLNALLPWHTAISLQHEPSVNFTPQSRVCGGPRNRKERCWSGWRNALYLIGACCGGDVCGTFDRADLKSVNGVLRQLSNGPTANGQRPARRKREVSWLRPLITWSARWRHASAPTAAVSMGPCVNTLVVLWIISYKTTPGSLSPLIRGDEILAGQRSAAAVAS